MQKIKNILSDEKITSLCILVGLIILGLIVRLIGLNKPDGFWYDELESYITAKNLFQYGIFSYNGTPHAPLFFLLLNLWMRFFGDNDTILRLLPVLFGILIIPATYFAGKELLSRKTGLIAAGIICINSLLIYYSQELRFYTLIPLLTTLSILFIIKINNKPDDVKSFIGLSLVNLLILYTSSIGLLFIFFELAIFGLYLYFSRKKSLKRLIISQVAVMFLYLPYIPTVIQQKIEYSRSFIPTFWWAKISLSTIFMTIQDWFSPVLVNLINPPVNYYQMVLSNETIVRFVIFAVIPSLIALYAITRTILERKFPSVLFLIGLLFFSMEIILTINKELALVSRYTLLILPIMVLSISYGLSKIKNKIIFTALLVIFMGVNLYFLVAYPASAPRMIRNEAYKTVSDILNKYNLTKNDIVIMTYGSKYLSKYYSPDRVTMVDFDLDHTYWLVTKDSLQKVFDKDLIKKINRNNYYDVLRDYIGSDQIPKTFENYIKSNVFDKLEKGRYFAVVVSRGIAFFRPQDLQMATSNDKIYKSYPIFFMLSSKTVNDLLNLSYSNLTPVYIESKGLWEVHIFKK